MSNAVILECVLCHDTRKFPAQTRYQGLPIEDWWLFSRASLCAKCKQRNDVQVPLPMRKAVRNSDPLTSQKAAKQILVRAGNQRHVLLTAYGEFDELTADEAMRRAGVSERSCYWKRISELREAGFIEATGAERPGESGTSQMVCRITLKGVAALQP